MTKAERENTEEGRKLVAQTKEIYEEMKRLQEREISIDVLKSTR